MSGEVPKKAALPTGEQAEPESQLTLCSFVTHKIVKKWNKPDWLSRLKINQKNIDVAFDVLEFCHELWQEIRVL